MRFRGKDDGDDANDGGGSVADRGFMTRGLLAVPYSEAAISRGARQVRPSARKTIRPGSAHNHLPPRLLVMVVRITMVMVMITMVVVVMVLTMPKTWTVVTLESHTKN